MWYLATLMVVFWGMQVVATLVFKYGSMAPARWMPCFVLGNVVGISGTWVWMVLFKQKLGANTVMGLGTGGAFLFGQIALALVFRGHFSWLHGVGVAAVLAGMLCLCLGETLKPSSAVTGATRADSGASEARVQAMSFSGAISVAGARGSDGALSDGALASSASPPAPGADAPSPPPTGAPATALPGPDGPRPVPGRPR